MQAEIVVIGTELLLGQIIDTDGAVRWISPLGIANALTAASLFFKNAVYETVGATLHRVDLDGTTTVLGDYSSNGVVDFHHNIDPGKTGVLLEADTTTYYESVIMEVSLSGTLLKTWNLADIIRAAMIAGGDDPTQFVFSTPTDWGGISTVPRQLLRNLPAMRAFSWQVQEKVRDGNPARALAR